MPAFDDLLQPVAGYYSEKVRSFGATPQGADWNGADGQVRRFQALLSLLPPGDPMLSLDDYGCGYGAMVDYLTAIGRRQVDYFGLDISADMVAAARTAHPDFSDRFLQADRSPRQADFAVMSGIFNVRLEIAADAWEHQIWRTLDAVRAASRRGFAFNCLTTYSDPPKRKDRLFYADPCRFFDGCKRRYSRDIALLHDYGLYEFTILVRLSDAANL